MERSPCHFTYARPWDVRPGKKKVWGIVLISLDSQHGRPMRAFCMRGEPTEIELAAPHMLENG